MKALAPNFSLAPLDDDLERKLTRVYVALELTRNVAKQGLGSDLTGPSATSMMSLLDVASQMLEDILGAEPSLHSPRSSSEEEIEMLM